MSRFFSIHFTITELKNIVRYIVLLGFVGTVRGWAKGSQHSHA